MFICGMVLHCSGRINLAKSGQVTADLTATVIHSYKSLINNAKAVNI